MTAFFHIANSPRLSDLPLRVELDGHKWSFSLNDRGKASATDASWVQLATHRTGGALGVEMKLDFFLARTIDSKLNAPAESPIRISLDQTDPEPERLAGPIGASPGGARLARLPPSPHISHLRYGRASVLSLLQNETIAGESLRSTDSSWNRVLNCRRISSSAMFVSSVPGCSTTKHTLGAL